MLQAVYNVPSPAEPRLDFSPQRSHYVLVPVSGTVSTQLDCDIQPGATPENYDIAWFRLNSHGGSASVYI